MHLLIYVMLIVGTSCVAHYRGGYESHNMIEREELREEIEGSVFVECPVCNNTSLLPSREECTIVRGNKKYKKCEYDTYINEVCDNRRDCYRGPGQQCTEKLEYDVYGQKCAHGYYCDSTFNFCVGLDYTIDNPMPWHVNHIYHYPLHDDKNLNKHKSAVMIIA